MTTALYFVDLEASGLHDGSYPTEVGWCRHDLRAGGSLLIRPAPAWRDGPWSAEAEQVTGIDQRTLGRHGLAPRTVAERLNAELAEAALYSDFPRGDGRWLQVLFEEARVAPALNQLADADVLVAAAARGLPLTAEALEVETAGIHERAGLVAHRALDDAVGHALSLGLVVVLGEHLKRATSPAADLEELVDRARALVAGYGRINQEPE